jgi:cytochrome P450
VSFHIVHDPVQVREVLRRSNDFLPSNALTSVVPLAPATLRVLSQAGFALPPVLASATGERHRQARAVVARFFSAATVDGVVAGVAELTRARCRSAIAALGRGAVDLAGVTQDIPPAIMTELTGIACPDTTQLKRWSRHSLELFWGWPDERRQLELAASAAQLYRWLRQQVLTSADSNGLLGALRGAGLSVADVCSLGYFLFIAAQETTAQLINIALYRALEERQLWSDLSAGASATDFVRSILASESPVATWRRTTDEDTSLGGVPLPAGTEILLHLTGNHPIASTPTAYTLAFGHGLHRCIGARLAEAEAVTVLQEVARTLPDIALTGPPPQWLRLLSFRTPLTVNVARIRS